MRILAFDMQTALCQIQIVREIPGSLFPSLRAGQVLQRKESEWRGTMQNTISLIKAGGKGEMIRDRKLASVVREESYVPTQPWYVHGFQFVQMESKSRSHHSAE